MSTPATTPNPQPDTDAMVWIEGGTFRMGSEQFYPEERPVHRVKVDGFFIDRHPVTNAEYARFVADTGYKTMAERKPDPKLYPGAPPEMLVPGSMVFFPTAGPVDLRNVAHWWRWVPGACWKRPLGPGSSVRGLGRHPVVHVCYEDAKAYCDWAGKELPTEAEWEYAARGGLDGARFVWGDKHMPEGRPMANTWQGRFPWENLGIDGYERTSPVGAFPPNGYGLFDMAGNVWEWTHDWYRARHPDDPQKACCTPQNPRGGAKEQSYDPGQPHVPIPRKVLKGGSHLCAPNYCFRYRPAARQPQMVETGMSHLGFRCVRRKPA
jgi:formylglycine-generating enzyme required for sulfatase activity